MASPMEIDAEIRRAHAAVELEMIKFASRPPTANIAASDLMTVRRNMAQLTRFFQRAKEVVHGFIWSARVEKWLVPQLITDDRPSEAPIIGASIMTRLPAPTQANIDEAIAIKLREELTTFEIYTLTPQVTVHHQGVTCGTHATDKAEQWRTLEPEQPADMEELKLNYEEYDYNMEVDDTAVGKKRGAKECVA
eukprot:jgi/Tetstr1/430444/TSEL_020254.t1